MSGAVVFESESMGSVVEVGPTEEATLFIPQWHLCLGPRQPGHDQQHPQARLHRRLGQWLRFSDYASELLDALCSGVFHSASMKFGLSHQPGTEGRIDGDDGFNKR